MPIMQYHSEFNGHRRPLRDRTPWHVAETTRDDRVVPVFRQLVRLRERLVGYLAEQAAGAVATDRPLMRPLFFDHPADPAAWSRPRQWKLGDDLLVNPVTEPGATSWTTALPEGDWVDVWSGARTPGGREHRRETPIHLIPVYCRAGSWPRLADVFA
jgi:alpha-glucosidase (family GH31 glycosyl hydrolase)